MTINFSDVSTYLLRTFEGNQATWKFKIVRMVIRKAKNSCNMRHYNCINTTRASCNKAARFVYYNLTRLKRGFDSIPCLITMSKTKMKTFANNLRCFVTSALWCCFHQRTVTFLLLILLNLEKRILYIYKAYRFVLVIAWGRVKLRINITRVFRNYRNCPSRAATRAISAISENTSDINP